MYFAEIQKITEIFYLIDTQSIAYFELLFLASVNVAVIFPESKRHGMSS